MNGRPDTHRRPARFETRDLELFSHVVEAGSITHGAERVHLSLPSASARIRSMEQVTGTALLRRERRGVSPTPAGQLLLRHARTVLHQIDRMTGELAEYSDGLVATVRVLANTAAVESTLPRELNAFLLAHPQIDVDLLEQASQAIIPAVADGRAEIGIVADTADTGRLPCVPLRSDRLVLIVANDHARAGSRRVSFRETLGEPYVGLTERSPLQEHLEGQAHPLGQRPLYRVRLPGSEAVCQAVSAGVGISVLPENVVARFQSIHPVTQIALDDPWAERSLVLCSRGEESLSGPALLLYRHIRTSMGAELA